MHPSNNINIVVIFGSLRETMELLALQIATNDHVHSLFEFASITRESYQVFVTASELFFGVNQKLLYERMVEVSQGQQEPLFLLSLNTCHHCYKPLGRWASLRSTIFIASLVQSPILHPSKSREQVLEHMTHDSQN